MLSDHDRANFQHVMTHGNWFSAKLLRLICDADLSNRRRIAQGFPDVVEAWNYWFRTGNAPTRENMANEHTSNRPESIA